VVFDQVIESSVVDCFSVRELALCPAEAVRPPAPYAEGAILTFISLFGEHLTGTLLLAVRPDLAEALSLAVGPGGETQAAHLDALAELSNELLGRIKNRLLPYGVTFQLGLPKALACAGFWLHTVTGETRRAHRFTSPRGDVWVWFDVVVGPDFRMLPFDESSAKCLPEGELVLF
jgi:hypothetical protein